MDLRAPGTAVGRVGPPAPDGPADLLEPLAQLFRDLRASPRGLPEREAARRLEVSGPNERARRGGRRWPGELAAQFTQPLAVLLAVAAALAWASGTPRLGIAIAAVIVLNAGFAFAQEMQAEKAVEALAAFLPERARVRRDGTRQEIEARLLVPGDVLLIEEGESVCADARLMTGTLEVDMSTLTGESVPVTRSAGPADPGVPLLPAADVVFSGTTCTGGEAEALVTATGMGTELGRIAALSQRAGHSESPLEHQVKRATMLIAFVAVGAGIAFLPIGLAAGLSMAAAASFAIGLTVMQILAIDLGTDTLPALALSREPAEPGPMDRPPRPRTQGVISRAMLARAWGFLGLISATLIMTGFYLTLRHAGWHPGAATGPHTPLNHAYRQATTVAWLGIVACQIGTAFAVRTDHASLRSVGVFSNRFLLGAIAIALAFAAALIYIPALNSIFGTAPLSGAQLATVGPFPFIVWGADELRRLFLRHHRRTRPGAGQPRRDTVAPTQASSPARLPAP